MTNYYLKTSGVTTVPGLLIYSGGTLNIGTSGTPVSGSSTAVLEFACLSDGQYGLTARNGSTFNAYGNPLSFVATKLNADVAANATSMTTVDTTGWQSGDQVVVASTTQTPGQTELLTIGSPTGTSIPIAVGGGTGGNSFLNAHSGTNFQNGQGKAEVTHLTRNVKIRSSTSTFNSYINAKPTCALNLYYIEMYYLSGNAAGLRGLELESIVTANTLIGCSLHDGLRTSLCIVNASLSNVTFSSCNFYNLNTISAAIDGILTLAGTFASFTSCTFSNIFSTGTQSIRLSGSPSFTSCTWFGCISNSAVFGFLGAGPGTFNGNVFHSNSMGFAPCLNNGSVQFISIDSCYFWRNTGYGIGNTAFMGTWRMTNSVLFGNSPNITANSGNIFIENCTIDGGTTVVSAQGISITTASSLVIINTTIGVNSPHSSADIIFGSTAGTPVQMYNVTLGSTTKISGLTVPLYNSCVRAHRYGQTSGAGTDISFYKFGTITSDATTRHTASGFSWKMTPTSATRVLSFPGPTEYDKGFSVPVLANQAVSISLWVLYDGSYNGSVKPTLILLGGLVQGIASDVTSIAPSGNPNVWQQLTVSGTPTETGLLELRVDCLGTAGNVYLDDPSFTQTGVYPNTFSMDVPSRGLPVEWIFGPQTNGISSALSNLTFDLHSRGLPYLPIYYPQLALVQQESPPLLESFNTLSLPSPLIETLTETETISSRILDSFEDDPLLIESLVNKASFPLTDILTLGDSYGWMDIVTPFIDTLSLSDIQSSKILTSLQETLVTDDTQFFLKSLLSFVDNRTVQEFFSVIVSMNSEEDLILREGLTFLSALALSDISTLQESQAFLISQVRIDQVRTQESFIQPGYPTLIFRDILTLAEDLSLLQLITPVCLLTGILKDPKGQVIPYGQVILSLDTHDAQGYMITNQSVYINPVSLTLTANAQGVFSVHIWGAGQTTPQARYLLTLPTGERLSFLGPDTETMTLDTLLSLSTTYSFPTSLQ